MGYVHSVEKKQREGPEIRVAMELKGSRTEKNMLTAFAGESQARDRCTYFSSQAENEGVEQGKQGRVIASMNLL